MFDKQLIRKNVIIILCIIAAILATMFIRRTISKYRSQADSSIDASLAFWVVSDSLQEGDVLIDNIAPGDETEVDISISNHNGSIGAQVPIEYAVIIETTTNMPLQYELYYKEDGNKIEGLETVESIYKDEDGTFYKKIIAEDLGFGMVSGDEGIDVTNFGLNVIFPRYDEDGLNDGEEDDENWQFADLVEHIKITIDAKQVMDESETENGEESGSSEEQVS